MLEELCKIAPITRIEVVGDTKLFYRVALEADVQDDYLANPCSSEEPGEVFPTDDDYYANIRPEQFDATLRSMQDKLGFTMFTVHIYCGTACVSAFMSSQNEGSFQFDIEEEPFKRWTVKDKLRNLSTDMRNICALADSDAYAELIEHLMQNNGKL